MQTLQVSAAIRQSFWHDPIAYLRRYLHRKPVGSPVRVFQSRINPAGSPGWKSAGNQI